MKTFEEKISQLTEQQALCIVASLSGEFATDETPERKEVQVQVLEELFTQEGQEVNVRKIEVMDTVSAANMAKRLLLLLGQSPRVRPSLDEWLDHPPVRETADVSLVLAAPVILTGCFTLLYVVGHIRFKRDLDGRWQLDYNQTTSPIDKYFKDIVHALANLIHSE